LSNLVVLFLFINSPYFEDGNYISATPPGLPELKKRVRPSAEMFGPKSQAEVLIVGPRFAGSLDHPGQL